MCFFVTIDEDCMIFEWCQYPIYPIYCSIPLFSTTSTQLKSIKYKMNCSNLVDFTYTSLEYQKYNCKVFVLST